MIGSGALVEPPMTILELVKAPGVAYVIYLYGHVMLLGLAYTAGMYSSPSPSQETKSISTSEPSILVYKSRTWRLRVHSLPNLHVHRQRGHLPGRVAPRRLSVPPT